MRPEKVSEQKLELSEQKSEQGLDQARKLESNVVLTETAPTISSDHTSSLRLSRLLGQLKHHFHAEEQEKKKYTYDDVKSLFVHGEFLTCEEKNDLIAVI